jgi:alanine racemase
VNVPISTPHPPRRDQYARPNCVEVDAAAIRHNIGELRRLAGPGTRLFIALKGNACGFDVAKAAAAVAAAGADALSTVDLGDALAIRDAGVDLPVLVYGGNLLTREVVTAIERFDLMLSLHDRSSAQSLARWRSKPITVFVEVNIGGERLGVDPDEAPQFVRRLSAQSGLTLGGVHAHMHVPDGAAGDEVVAWQFQRFTAVLRALEADGIEVPVRMIASSKTLVRTLQMNLNAIDPGHLAFGLMPTDSIAVAMDLRPAFRALKSHLIAVRRLAREQHLDRLPFPARAGMRFGVIPFGASDRLKQLGCGTVLVRSRRVSLLGPPSAEHARVDLTDVPDAEVGDEVVIIGRQGLAEITLDEVRRAQGNARSSDITRNIPSSIPRLYVEGGML